jgi:hypothetical protein
MLGLSVNIVEETVELFRQSKAPVKLENYKRYQEDWVKFYDAVMAKYALDMEKVHNLLEKGEKRLIKKWNKKVEIPYPKTVSEMNELLEEYMVPIMFAQTADKSRIVGVIMDEYS